MIPFKNKLYINDELYYEIFRLKKRIIYSPCEKLRFAQQYFLNAIKFQYKHLIKTTHEVAQVHLEKKWVMKLDLKDFYNSVPYSKIEQVVSHISKNIKNANVNYYLDILTLDKKLPTGALTSAHIANLCFLENDKLISDYCDLLNVNYSRYMDDMIFSSDDKKLLNKVEERVRQLITVQGYKLNENKTKYISENKQQNVLGLIVNNKKVTLPNKYKREIRASIHSYIVYLSDNAAMNLKHRVWNDNEVDRLFGHIAYIKSVDLGYYNKLKVYINKLEQKYSVSFNK